MKKIVYSLVLFVSLAGNYAQASNYYDESGRTELMNYLIEQEAKIDEFRKKVLFIENSCTVTNEHEHGATFKFETTYSQEDSRRKWIQKELPFWLKYRALVKETISHMKIMIDKGACVQTKSRDGKSLLAYCKTKAIYEFLRAEGVSFEILAGMYFMDERVWIFGILGITVLPLMIAANQRKIENSTFVSDWERRSVSDRCKFWNEFHNEKMIQIMNDSHQDTISELHRKLDLGSIN